MEDARNDLRFAMVCSANVNRSVAAHILLQENGLNVCSFGAGNSIKLPGSSAASPNVYKFGEHTYQHIISDLESKDSGYYTRNGLLDMLRRDMKLKPAPQRWQDWTKNGDNKPFDVVVTFERRVLDAVVTHMNSQYETGLYPTLVVNMEVRDSLKDAGEAAPRALVLCQMLAEAEDWGSQVDGVVEKFREEYGIQLGYTVCWSPLKRAIAAV